MADERIARFNVPRNMGFVFVSFIIFQLCLISSIKDIYLSFSKEIQIKR